MPLLLFNSMGHRVERRLGVSLKRSESYNLIFDIEQPFFEFSIIGCFLVTLPLLRLQEHSIRTSSPPKENTPQFQDQLVVLWIAASPIAGRF